MIDVTHHRHHRGSHRQVLGKILDLFFLNRRLLKGNKVGDHVVKFTDLLDQILIQDLVDGGHRTPGEELLHQLVALDLKSFAQFLDRYLLGKGHFSRPAHFHRFRGFRYRCFSRFLHHLGLTDRFSHRLLSLLRHLFIERWGLRGFRLRFFLQ